MENYTFLKVAVLPILGFFEVKFQNGTDASVTGGIEFHLFNIVLKSLRLPFQVHIPKELDWGEERNDGYWTGLVGMVLRNESDLAFGSVPLTEERASVVDYIYPHTMLEGIFVTRIPKRIYSPLTFIHVFDSYIWIAVWVTTMCIFLVLKCAFSTKYASTTLFFNIMSTIFSQNAPFRSSKLTDRILVGSVIAGFFFLFASYSSLLLAFLTTTQTEKPVKNLKTLVEAVKNGDMKVFFPSPSVIENLSKHPDSDVKFLATQAKKNRWCYTGDEQFLRRNFFEERNALVADRNSAVRSLLGTNTFLPSDDSIMFRPRSIIQKKNSPLRKEIDEVIHRMTAAGIYEKNINDYAFRKEISRKHPRIELDEKLSMQKLQGVFLTLFIGYALSISVLVMEFFYFHLFEKKSQKEITAPHLPKDALGAS